MPDTTTATGAERVAEAFETAEAEGRAALMPYMMGGYPDPAGSLAIAEAYIEGGADLIELGIPFSDPLADGPVIHTAATAALAAGADLESVLDVCSEISSRVPVMLMVYANMVLAGPGGAGGPFAKRADDAGAAGVIIPDLPLGEGGEARDAFRRRGLAVAPLVAPTTGPERRAAICESAEGFVYVVSDVGTTGERDELPPGLTALIEAVDEDAEVPVAVGFGIGTPEQAAQVGDVADGVIIGSRLVRAVADAESTEAAATSLRDFLRNTHAALAA